MNTVVESPARQLRRELGLSPVTRGTRRDGAYGNTGFNCGDRVRFRDDYHEGVVVGITSGQLHARWDGSPALHEYNILPEDVVRV